LQEGVIFIDKIAPSFFQIFTMKKSICVLLVLLPLHAQLVAEIHHVPSEFPLIQTALDSCAWGDTVLVAPGTYNELIHVPTTELTLASNYLFSQDTTDINETILDGELEGTILDLLPGIHRVFSIYGFTLKRGMGFYDPDSGHYIGGAVNASDSLTLVVENCVFTENESPNEGAAICIMDGIDGDLVLRDLKLFNNDHQDSHYLHIISGGASGVCILERIHAIGFGENEYLIRSGGQDSVVVRNLIVENFNNQYGDIVQLSTRGTMVVEGLVCRSNYILFGNIVNLDGYGGSSVIHIRNSSVTDNPRTRGISAWADYLFIDNLYFQNNQSAIITTCGEYYSEIWGEVNDLVVQDNTMGSFGYYEGYSNESIFITNCSIRNALFENNTILMHHDPEDPDDAVAGGKILDFMASDRSCVIENCLFTNNFHDDPDDYSNPNVNPLGTQGRVLYMRLLSDMDLTVRHCLFENNRQPNIAPDRPYLGCGSDGVGSTIYGYGTTSTNRSIHFEDVIVRDNDDGGIYLECFDYVSLRNIQVVNTPRQGVRVLADSILAENIFISGVIEQKNYHSYPYTWCMHVALSLIGTEFSLGRNITLIDCDLPYILIGGSSSLAQTSYENCIFWGNSYDIWQKPFDYPQPIAYTYSLLQENIPGEGNIFDVDPLLHSELGAPYLELWSPCVDAGNPNVIYNDPEDPDDPGSPLWPAQGTLRNDMGFTGGPWAMVQEFEGIADPDAVQVFPQRIYLSQNYPNPFNPTTTIEFALPHTQQIQLTVYNLLGQRVGELAQGAYTAGRHQVQFDGSRLASGVYVYQLVAGDQVETKKMMLVK